MVRPGEALCPTVDLGTLCGMAILMQADAEAVEADLASIRQMEARGELFELRERPRPPPPSGGRRKIAFAARAAPSS